MDFLLFIRFGKLLKSPIENAKKGFRIRLDSQLCSGRGTKRLERSFRVPFQEISSGLFRHFADTSLKMRGTYHPEKCHLSG
jgi:hypothetical protein